MTLIGAPGVGNSRLAMAASRAVEREFVGGVWFVELARAAQPADVARVVAQTLDARGPAPIRDPLGHVVQRLRDADVDTLGGECNDLSDAVPPAALVCPGPHLQWARRRCMPDMLGLVTDIAAWRA